MTSRFQVGFGAETPNGQCRMVEAQVCWEPHPRRCSVPPTVLFDRVEAFPLFSDARAPFDAFYDFYYNHCASSQFGSTPVKSLEIGKNVLGNRIPIAFRWCRAVVAVCMVVVVNIVKCVGRARASCLHKRLQSRFSRRLSIFCFYHHAHSHHGPVPSRSYWNLIFQCVYTCSLVHKRTEAELAVCVVVEVEISKS